MAEFITIDALTSNSYVSTNFQAKNLQIAIREATRSLKEVVGENLYIKLCDMVDSGSLTGKYKILKEDYLDYYLYWRSTYELQVPNTFKTTQAGTVKTVDPSVESNELNNIMYLTNFYKNKCNQYSLDAQKYIKDNSSSFPEYHTENSFQQSPINNFNCPVQLDIFTKKCNYK